MEKKFGKKERNYQRQIQGLTKQHAEDLRKVNISCNQNEILMFF